MQVNFAAFRGLVDAIDGVPIYVPRPARDEETGLDLPDVGCRMLDPTEALSYVRSRHYEELIGSRWVEDPRSDIGRIARQQDFIRRALTRAIDRGARNPGRSTSSSTSGWTASPSTVSSRPATSSTWAPGSGPSTPTACRPTPWPARRTR